MKKIDLNEYSDIHEIIGSDGYITPRATFLIVRDNNQYMSDNVYHSDWAKEYVREAGLSDWFNNSIYNDEFEFLENTLQYIRFAYVDLVTTSLRGRDPWDIYKEYDNGKYNEDQIAFLKKVCQTYIDAGNLDDNIRKK